MQVRSVAVVPALATLVPAAQLVQAVHDPALVVVLTVPLAQVVHVRFAVVEPAALSNVPAEQVPHATHAVAELPSLSH